VGPQKKGKSRERNGGIERGVRDGERGRGERREEGELVGE